MELEKQVCNLELSRKLKKLGVKQESLWYWWKNWAFPKVKNPKKPRGKSDFKDSEWKSIEHYVVLKNEEGNRSGYNRLIASAFTVAELGEMLPSRFMSGKTKKGYSCRHDGGNYNFHYSKKVPAQIADTEANARAKILIYLLENRLIKA